MLFMEIRPLYPITFLRTNNIKETRHFYENIMNFPLALEQSGCFVYRVGKYGYWGFCENTKEPVEKAEQVCLTVVVKTLEEVDKWHKHMVDSGVTVARSPQKTEQYKIYNGFYADPSGYTIEIQYFFEEGEPVGHKEF